MVKRKKRLLLFVCVLLLIIGWTVTFISVTAQGEDIVGSQNELVVQARQLSQDKLYKRAELLYTQALTDYDTVYNTDIERELLELYKEADDSSAYYSLMEERVDAARAEEDEYIELSTRYADSRRKEDAIDIARRGLSAYASTQLENIYNSLLYEYKTVTVGFDEFTLPADGDLIPYYNGTSWGYVNSDGDMVLSPVYEEATAFSGDYAVLKLIECLKKSGLEIRDIKQFMEWCQEGSRTYELRKQLFERQKAAVEKEMKKMQETLDMLTFKCFYYEQAIKDGNEDGIHSMLPDKLPADIQAAYDNSHK